MFTLLQLVAFGILFTINFDIIRSMILSIPTAKFTPSSDDFKLCQQNPENCVDLKTYPKEHVESLVAKNKLFKEAFIVDKPPTKSAAHENQLYEEIFDTVRERDDYQPLCKFRKIFQEPQIAYSLRGGSKKPQYILQESGYKQGFFTEECLPNDAGHMCIHIQTDMKLNTTCKQKYGSIYLWALDIETGNPEMIESQQPTGCFCSYNELSNYE